MAHMYLIDIESKKKPNQWMSLYAVTDLKLLLYNILLK